MDTRTIWTSLAQAQTERSCQRLQTQCCAVVHRYFTPNRVINIVLCSLHPSRADHCHVFSVATTVRSQHQHQQNVCINKGSASSTLLPCTPGTMTSTYCTTPSLMALTSLVKKQHDRVRRVTSALLRPCGPQIASKICHEHTHRTNSTYSIKRNRKTEKNTFQICCK